MGGGFIRPSQNQINKNKMATNNKKGARGGKGNNNNFNFYIGTIERRYKNI